MGLPCHEELHLKHPNSIEWVYFPAQSWFTPFDCNTSSKIYWKGHFTAATGHALRASPLVLSMSLWIVKLNV